MAFDLKMNVKLGQSLLMTPQLQQAIKLLQLSRLELEQFVTNQLAENPTLEEGQYETDEERREVEKNHEVTESDAANDHMQAASEIVDKMPDSQQSEHDWEAFSRAQEQAAPTPSAVRRQNDDEASNYENYVARASTLAEHIMSQVGEIDFDEDETRIANAIVGNIDEKGYLRTTVEEIAESEKVELDQVEDILDCIQRLDPPGIASRDVKECLLNQLRNNRLRNGVVEKIVENHLTELETRNFNAIAKALKISLDVVIENVQIISELEPVPGRQFTSEATQYIAPDVYVFKLGSEWVVSLNEEGLPRLRVSKMYRDMVSNKVAAGQDKDYLQEKLKSAVWLIKSIQQRQRTIFRVTECIVERQKDFFELGVEHLKPMILKDIAEDISMHESTISRVTNNKYVHTPRGIFELKYFFNSSVQTVTGQSMASESVKFMIEEIIKGEDVKKPMSDQKIVEILDERGIQLARRTVAKYREQLGILPSSKRKKYF